MEDSQTKTNQVRALVAYLILESKRKVLSETTFNNHHHGPIEEVVTLTKPSCSICYTHGALRFSSIDPSVEVIKAQADYLGYHGQPASWNYVGHLHFMQAFTDAYLALTKIIMGSKTTMKIARMEKFVSAFHELTRQMHLAETFQHKNMMVCLSDDKHDRHSMIVNNYLSLFLLERIRKGALIVLATDDNFKKSLQLVKCLSIIITLIKENKNRKSKGMPTRDDMLDCIELILDDGKGVTKTIGELQKKKSELGEHLHTGKNIQQTRKNVKKLKKAIKKMDKQIKSLEEDQNQIEENKENRELLRVQFQEKWKKSFTMNGTADPNLKYSQLLNELFDFIESNCCPLPTTVSNEKMLTFVQTFHHKIQAHLSGEGITVSDDHNVARPQFIQGFVDDDDNDEEEDEEEEDDESSDSETESDMTHSDDVLNSKEDTIEDVVVTSISDGFLQLFSFVDSRLNDKAEGQWMNVFLSSLFWTSTTTVGRSQELELNLYLLPMMKESSIFQSRQKYDVSLSDLRIQTIESADANSTSTQARQFNVMLTMDPIIQAKVTNDTNVDRIEVFYEQMDDEE